ncbi:ATP10 protein-domain-containing protein [Annulohypoxylon maeteangense]|uniref:ATP10 protein-domain-containing protein n=1 Tax=Annulohypoxylon maeteangense TaxID=1927788 RepID=UPI002007598E|nr:ATP10 protein-domain-containing protein [Annulohypoxylon maeteangense]KAI0889970.1 ATP10 protein-domain-containing protein [Annulohypoxylon maeteangense]
MSFARRPRLLCLLCQSRAFSTSYRLLAEQGAAAKAATKTNNHQSTKAKTAKTTTTPNSPAPPRVIAPSPLEDAPRGYGKRHEEFTPKPLSRPIGMPLPPQPGENTGIDHRTLKQRRDDFVNYDKHLKRREELKSKMARPYFRDWGNLRFHKGKTFIAPPRMFKSDLSLFFPNVYGRTLLKSDTDPRDTTPTLKGKISVVSVFSNVWAENQVKTFVDKKSNPMLDHLLEQNKQLAQRVWINIEENSLKAFLIKLFLGGIRRRIGEPNWGRYFIVRKGVSDEIQESIGLLNKSVGYVYLVDSQCRIRWAGSGPSEADEREGLAYSIQRLLDEEKKMKGS